MRRIKSIYWFRESFNYIAVAAFAFLLSSWFVSAFAGDASPIAGLAVVNPNDLLGQYKNASPADDLATRVMVGLLGAAYNNPMTTGISSTLFGAIFMVFNVIVFAVATVWGSYGVIAGIVQTAHEGVALGRRMNAIWMPLRMVTGIGGLVPAFGGFSLSQVTMILATSWGISFANYGYIAALDAANTSASLTSPAFSRTDSTRDPSAMAQVLFAQSLCELSYADKSADFALHSQVISPVDVVKEFSFSNIYRTGTVKGRSIGVEGNEAGCFAVGIRRKEVSKPRTGDSTSGFRSTAVDYDAINKQSWDGYANNFQDGFVAKVKLIAKAYYDAKKASPTKQISVPLDQLRAAGADYMALASSSGFTIDAGKIKSDAMANMKKYGFFAAGSFYSTLAEVNAASTQAADAVEFLITAPVERPTMASGDYDAIYDSAMKVSGSGKGNEKAPTEICAKMLGPLGLSYDTNAGDNNNCSYGQHLISVMLGAGTSGAGGGSTMVDPIIAMKNIGDYMMMTGEVFLVGSLYASGLDEKTGGVGSAVAGWVSRVPIVGSALKPFVALGTMAPYIGGLLFSVGALCSIYIPMVPLITWMAALVQYCCVVVESFAAAPLWSLAHIQAEGEGMGQRTEKGYLYLLNLLFRPILMVVAFFAASALVILLGSVFIQMYAPAIASAQGNSITGIGSIIGYVFLFFVIMNTIIQGLFHLVMELADDAIGWVGGIGRSSIGRDHEGKMHNLFIGGGRFGAGAVDRAIGNAAAKKERNKPPATTSPTNG